MHHILGVEKNITTSLLNGNVEVINEPKTGKAFMRGICKFAGPRYNGVMKVNPVGKTLSEVNRAYLAGLVDGDGAIMACIERHPEKKFRFRVRINIKISQNEDRILRWCKRITGFGHIRHNRTQYEWVSCDQKEIRKFLIFLLPYLKVKKSQAKLAIRILDAEVKTLANLIKIARLADALAKFNARSIGRRRNFVKMIKESVSSND
jgi:hypothetical protein